MEECMRHLTETDTGKNKGKSNLAFPFIKSAASLQCLVTE